VTLLEKADEIGGQLNMAKVVPGKEEFVGLVNWYQVMVARSAIKLRLGRKAVANDVAGFDEVIIATGVVPRDPQIPGQDAPNVLSYIDVLRHRVVVGASVAIVGAGGIGFDVAEFLSEDGQSPTLDLEMWKREWGISDPAVDRGGLAALGPQPQTPARQVTLLQRKSEKLGRRLGKTTGWIHRATLAMKGVRMLGGVNYERITADGIHISFGDARENPELIAASQIILCAGQLSERSLADELAGNHASTHIIGGAELATELDAKRAIDQGARLAANL